MSDKPKPKLQKKPKFNLSPPKMKKQPFLLQKAEMKNGVMKKGNSFSSSNCNSLCSTASIQCHENCAGQAFREDLDRVLANVSTLLTLNQQALSSLNLIVIEIEEIRAEVLAGDTDREDYLENLEAILRILNPIADNFNTTIGFTTNLLALNLNRILTDLQTTRLCTGVSSECLAAIIESVNNLGNSLATFSLDAAAALTAIQTAFVAGEALLAAVTADPLVLADITTATDAFDIAIATLTNALTALVNDNAALVQGATVLGFQLQDCGLTAPCSVEISCEGLRL